MADATVDSVGQQYACKCINVRLRTAPTQSAPPETPSDPDYTRIHVGDEGIQVVHPQLTLRVKSRGETLPGTSRCARFTTLFCLVCDLPIYRVHQVISIEVEGKDAPLLPSDDWAEQEIMKSPSGWIDVHKDSLCGHAVTEAESSDRYSRVYAIILPNVTETTPPPPAAPPISQSTPPSTPTSSVSYLTNLPSLFPPSSFLPNHPTFLHLVSLAEKESQSIRAKAEEEIAAYVKAKVTEIQTKEAQVKKGVEQLWLQSRAILDRLRQEKSQSHSSTITRIPTRPGDHRNGDRAYGTPIAIRDFVPTPVTTARSTPVVTPKMSALSASLANTSLHQAMADRKSTKTNDSNSTSSARSASPGSAQVPVNQTEMGTVLRFKRNFDESVNYVASYKYFLDVEGEMAKRKKEREEKRVKEEDLQGILPPQSKESKHKDSTKTPESQSRDDLPDEKQTRSTVQKSKKKRVHFDVEPTAAEPPRASNPDSKDDMVFSLDDDLEEETRQSSNIKNTLPLVDQPSIPRRTRRTRRDLTSSLPSSFFALRPVSLPPPSQVRPPQRVSLFDPSRNNFALSLPHQSALDAAQQDEKPADLSQPFAEDISKTDEENPEESEDTTTTTTRSSSEESDESESEGEGEYRPPHNIYGLPGSLPINIVSKIRPREVLSLASYTSKGPLSSQSKGPAPPELTFNKRMTPAAIRRAAYAERDRNRSLDPGTLDFLPEEDEDESEEEKKKVSHSLESGERARKHALKILQARAEIPEEGMWRSLAD